MLFVTFCILHYPYVQRALSDEFLEWDLLVKGMYCACWHASNVLPESFPDPSPQTGDLIQYLNQAFPQVKMTPPCNYSWVLALWVTPEFACDVQGSHTHLRSPGEGFGGWVCRTGAPFVGLIPWCSPRTFLYAFLVLVPHLPTSTTSVAILCQFWKLVTMYLSIYIKA